MSTTSSKVADKVKEELLRKVEEARTSAKGYKPEAADFDDTEERTIDYAKGTFKFSEVYGFMPPSGIDHAVHKFEVDDWSPDMHVHIPKISAFDGYQAQHEALEMCVLGMEMGDKVSITGPTGSGKSSMVKYICALSGRPFIRINGRGDLESDSLLGMMTAKGGDTQWVDGTITEGIKHGATICIDEWDVIPPEIIMALQWLMEEGGALYLSDKPGSSDEKLVVPEPRYNLIFTGNTRGMGDETGRHSATNVQNTATIDRFGVAIHLGYLTLEHELAVLKGKHHDLDDKLGKKMIKFASLVRQAYDTSAISMTCSPRTLLNWCGKAQYLRSTRLALRMSFFEKLPNDAERTTVAGFYKTVFNEDLFGSK